MSAAPVPVEPDLKLILGTPKYRILEAFRTDRSRCAFIMGPLGSGKTYAAIVKLLKVMIEQEANEAGVRPTRFVAVRNTYGDLTETTIKDFRQVFTDKFGNFKMGGLEPPTFRVGIGLTDGTRVESEVIFLALDRADSVKRLRGYQVTGFWMNETKELVKPIIDIADLRHGRYPSRIAGGVKPTWHGMIGDTNAPDEDHWYYHMAEEDRPGDWRFFRQPGGVFRTGRKDVNGREIWAPNAEAENLSNLPEQYYVRGMQGKTDAWIAVNLANEYGFVTDGKPVHPEFIDSFHVSSQSLEYEPSLPLLLGVDFGRTPAAAICQRLPQWDRFVVIDEFVTDDMSQAVFGPELKRYINANYPGAKVRGWADPAGDAKSQATEDTPLRILNAAGVPCQAAPSNQPTLRRAAVANPLTRICGDGLPALLISPKAKIIRKGLAGGFCFRRLKIAGDDRYTDEPDKNMYSHPVEALEYMCLGEGEGTAALLPADYDEDEPFQEYAEF